MTTIAGNFSGRDDTAMSCADLESELRRRFSLAPEAAIYAIPQPLLQIVRERIPRVMSANDFALETRLSQTHGGIHSGRMFTYPISLCGGDFVANAEARNLGMSDEVFNDTAEARRLVEAWSENNSEDRRQATALLARETQSESASFAVWVLSQPEFREDRDRLRARGAKEIARKGFPASRLSFFGGRNESDRAQVHSHKLLAQFDAFRDKWCLDTLATWEIPVPLTTSYGDMVRDFGYLGGSGLTLFLPWSALRQPTLPLRAAASAHGGGIPRNLAGWFHTKNLLGGRRAAVAFKIYIYLFLGLVARYPKQLYRKLRKLDGVFHEYCYPDSTSGDDQSARDLRRLVQKELVEHPPDRQSHV